MKINPRAVNNSDTLSVLVIDSISKWKVLALFATVFTGKHLHFKEVETIRAKKISVECIHVIPFQVDGETGETMNSSIIKQPIPIKVKGCYVKMNKTVP